MSYSGGSAREVDLVVRLASLQAVAEIRDPAAAARAVLQAVAGAIPFDWAIVIAFHAEAASVIATYPAGMLGIDAGGRLEPLDYPEQLLRASGEPSLDGDLRAGRIDRSPLVRLPLLGVRSVLRVPLFDPRGVAGAVLLFAQQPQAFTAAQAMQVESYLRPLARRLFPSSDVAEPVDVEPAAIAIAPLITPPESEAAVTPPAAAPDSSSYEVVSPEARRSHLTAVPRHDPDSDAAPAAAPDLPAGSEPPLSWPAAPREHPAADTLSIDDQARRFDDLNALSDLVSGVAHELNNPLTTILGFAQVLSALGETERIHALSMIEQEAQRAGRIVRNLLYFARQHRPRIEPIDLNALLTRVIEVRRYQFDVDNIEVALDLAPLPQLQGDQYQLEQAFLNLINNAYQAMQTTGGTISVQTSLDGDRVRISVADTGPGIPDALLTRIFEPFFTTREVGEGTGLGLSTAYGIVREHGGRLWAENMPGGGARFVVELPLAAQDGTQHTVATPHVTGRGHGERLLVVDDEPAVRSLVREILEGFNYRVLGAASGAAALAILEETPCAAVICDVRMPGMDGYEFYRRLVDRWPALRGKVIFVTGDIHRETRLPADEGVRFLEKPFDVHDLVSAVQHTLGQATADQTTLGQGARSSERGTVPPPDPFTR